MNTATKTALQTNATRIATWMAAVDEDGDGSPIQGMAAKVSELAQTLLAIRDTAWSRTLLTVLPMHLRDRVIAAGRQLKAA